MELTQHDAFNYIYPATAGDFKKFGEKAQQTWEKLSIKHSDYMNDEEKKEFIKNLKEFLDLENVDFETKIVSLHTFCRYPKQVNEILHFISHLDK